MATKQCCECSAQLPLSAFCDKQTKCRECQRIYEQARRRTDGGFVKKLLNSARAHTKERVENGRPMCDVGITVDDWNAHWNRIGGRSWRHSLVLRPLSSWQASLERRDNDKGYDSFYHPVHNPDGNVMIVALEWNTAAQWTAERVAQVLAPTDTNNASAALQFPDAEEVTAAAAEMAAPSRRGGNRGVRKRQYIKNQGITTHATCSACHAILPTTQFSEDNRRTDKLQAKCTTCPANMANTLYVARRCTSW